VGGVHSGDVLVAKYREDESILLSNGNIKVKYEDMSMQMWLKEVYGCSSVQTYNFSIHKECGKTLSQKRKEYIENQIG
jgi:hypothetical protein